MPAYLPALIVCAVIVWLCCLQSPQAPAAPPGDREHPIAVAADYAVSVAALGWCLVWLAVAFAPIGLLVWWVAS